MRLSKSCILLAIIGVFSFIFIFITPNNWIKDFSLNFTTEVIGILLTVILIDMILKRKEEKDRIKRQKIALKQLKPHLLRHLHLLFNIYKASTLSKPKKCNNDISEFFNENYYSEIKYFDFSKKAPVLPERSWFSYLYEESKKCKDALNENIGKYGMYFDSDVIDLIEKVINSHLTEFLIQFKDIHELDKKRGFKRKYTFFSGEGMTDLVKKHIELFIELLEL